MDPSPYIWGIDTSSKLLAVAVALEDRVVADRGCTFDKDLAHGERLDRIYSQTLRMAGELADEFPPAKVFVEELVVFPGRTSPILYQAKGVIEAALFAATRVDVVPVANATWKRRAVGYGAAKKHEVFAWARRHGYEGVSQDAADAWGTAIAGWRIEHEPVQEELVA